MSSKNLKQRPQKPTCKYCERPVSFGPGFMMIEAVHEDDSFIAHEECYQISGDDEGYIERLYNALEEEDTL